MKWQHKTDIYDVGRELIKIIEKNVYVNEFINVGYTEK